MKNLFFRFLYPVKGLCYALVKDFSFQTQFVGGLLYIFIIWLIFNPLVAWEWLFIMLAWTLVLITELQNSALEEALDKIHPERHENIGRSKDMAAGAVLLAAMFAVGVTLVLFLERGWF